MGLKGENEDTENGNVDGRASDIGNQKKAALLYVFQILKDKTNEDDGKYLHDTEISRILRDEYHIKYDRKSVARAIDTLNGYFEKNPEYGCKIVKDNNEGEALDFSRKELEESQITFLIDLIYSSKSIPSNYAKELIDYFLQDASDKLKNRYKFINHSDSLTRTDNRDVFYNIDQISDAMEQKKKIGFKYCDYDEERNLVPRKNNHIYITTPRYLVSSNGTYYLLCDYKKNGIVIYKINQMKDIEVREEDGIPAEQSTNFGPDFNLGKFVNEHIYLFSGKVIDVKFTIKEQKNLTYVFDWFGENASITKDGDEYIVTAKVDEIAFEYWVMQYLDVINVLEPQSVRKYIVDTCRKAIKNHASPSENTEPSAE